MCCTETDSKTIYDIPRDWPITIFLLLFEPYRENSLNYKTLFVTLAAKFLNMLGAFIDQFLTNVKMLMLHGTYTN